MKKKLLTMILTPIVGWVVKKVIDKIVVTRQQHQARERIAPVA